MRSGFSQVCMENPQKEPTPLNQTQDSKLCLNCGFPNRLNDVRCLYCDTSLIDDGGLISWLRQTYYVLRWRWDLKQKRERVKHPKSFSPPLKSLGYLVLGAILSGAGLFLFIEAINRSSFSNAIISVLLLLYGFFTLKALINQRG